MKTQTYSSTSSDATYTAILNGDVVSCNCPGWTNTRKCWHIDDIRGIPRAAKGKKATTEGGPKPQALPLESIRPLPVLSMQASPLPEDGDVDDFMGPDWVMEEKYDGHRRIIEVTEAEVYMWSRQGNLQPVPRHLLPALRKLPPGIYDGEEIIPGGTSTDVKAGVNAGTSEMYLFDILRVGGSHPELNTHHLTFHERRQLLVVAGTHLRFEDPVKLSEQWKVSRLTLQAIWARGGEGAMVKKRSSRYHPGKRSQEWVKFKRFENLTVTLKGFEAGLLGPHSVIVSVDEAGTEVRCKTLDDALRAEFARNAEAYIGRKFNVEHQGRLKTGRYRSPMFDHFIE